MQLFTEVKITPLERKISYGDKLVFLGSCFADEVGSICHDLGFDALTNPFGVLFNPVSISNAIIRLKSGKQYTHNDVTSVGEGEFFCTFEHNTEFWSASEEGLLCHVNQELDTASQHFKSAKWVIVSLGTAWVYRHRNTLQIVSNCHKLPSQMFDRAMLTVDETTKILAEVVANSKDKNFIFTVSPLRHLKDGLHENQLSKATLLLAVDSVCKDNTNAFYFPAYEILLDELRDYRFYKEDMMHPTSQAVRHIWEKFCNFAITDESRLIMKEAEALQAMTRHRPMFPDSSQYHAFVKQKEEKTKELKREHPQVKTENIR